MKEAVMAVPTQHPAVVLRSHYTHVRVLLAIAMLAIVSLTVAVVILAANAGTTAPSAPQFSVPSYARDHGGAPVPDLRVARGQRYDGGPEEGTRGIAAATAQSNRFDGGPEEGSRGSGR
jgi:hypothetical protein